jgi:signal transduction histidine kinase
MRTWVRALGDPYRLRRWAYIVAIAVVVFSMLVSAIDDTSVAMTWIWPIVLITAATSVLVARWRAEILAVGACVLAFPVLGESSFVWPAVAALVCASLLADRRDLPLAGWIGGLGGAIASLVLLGNVAGDPFVAILLGGGVATLIRIRVRNAVLTDETDQLRGQAAWLEQRTLLARELHDVVGHQVTAMVVQAEAGLVDDPQEALRAIGGLGRTALSELDGLVVHLRDPDAPLTVSAPPQLLDIDEVLAAPVRQRGVEVYVMLGADLGLDEAGVLTMYRIAQEALTNIARHVKAEHAWVELDRHGGAVRLRVSDDGVGLVRQSPRGSGPVGIQERVAGRGGDWEIGERPGGGTMVTVVLPVTP